MDLADPDLNPALLTTRIHNSKNLLKIAQKWTKNHTFVVFVDVP